MKASEYMNGLKNLMISTEAHNLEAAKSLAEEAGVKWDPEEPELPREIRATTVVDCDGWHLLPAIPRGALSNDALRCIYFAAADAYNKLQRGELVEASVSAEEILKLLHERDNLKQSLDVAIRERDHLNRLLKCERDLVARLEERLKGVDALQERDVALAELRETRLLLRDIAAAVGLSWRPHETWAECSQLALDIRTAIVAHQRPADVISKTRGGRTVHYAIGPTRETREEAERDLREWFDKEAP